jgi:hypothetical protein
MNKLTRHMLENSQTEIVEETLGAEHTYQRHNQGVIAVAIEALNTPRLAPALNEQNASHGLTAINAKLLTQGILA